MKRIPENRLTRIMLEWEWEGQTQEMDDSGWNMTNRGRIDEDTGNRDVRINIVLGEGKQLYGGQIINENFVINVNHLLACLKLTVLQ